MLKLFHKLNREHSDLKSTEEDISNSEPEYNEDDDELNSSDSRKEVEAVHKR